MDRVIAIELGGNPLAVHVNKLAGPQPHPATHQEAAAVARRFLAAGYSVDLGLVQLNSANLSRFGLTIEDALDPCQNVAAGGQVLSGFYGKAVQQFGEGQPALMAALSGYNTGSFQRGFENGYVGKYYISANLPEPVIQRANGKSKPPAPPTFTTVAYDRPGLDLRIN